MYMYYTHYICEYQALIQRLYNLGWWLYTGGGWLAINGSPRQECQLMHACAWSCSTRFTALEEWSCAVNRILHSTHTLAITYSTMKRISGGWGGSWISTWNMHKQHHYLSWGCVDCGSEQVHHNSHKEGDSKHHWCPRTLPLLSTLCACEHT